MKSAGFKALQQHLLSLTRPGGFLHSVLVLAGGSGLSQIISVVSLPILSRLYSPVDFAVLLVFTTVFGFLAPVAAARLEMAIPIAPDEEDAIALLYVSLLSCSALSAVVAVLAVVLALLGPGTTSAIGIGSIHAVLWLMPLAVLLGGAQSVLVAWSTRRRRFRLITTSRVSQSLVAVIVQIGMGVAGWGGAGLVAGFTANNGVGAGVLAVDVPLSRLCRPRAEIARVIRAFSNFPRYSVFESLLLNISTGVPLLLLAAFAPGGDVGHFALAWRVMLAPLGLIGITVGQVFTSHAAEEFELGRFSAFTASVMRGLVMAGIGPIIAVAIAGPSLFEVVFGEQWRRAGEIVGLLVPWLSLQFLARPMFYTMYVMSKQRLALLVEAAGCAIRIVPVFVVGLVCPHYTLLSLVVSATAYHLMLLIVVMIVSKLDMRQLFVKPLRPAMMIVLWGVVGFACAKMLA